MSLEEVCQRAMVHGTYGTETEPLPRHSMGQTPSFGMVFLLDCYTPYHDYDSTGYGNIIVLGIRIWYHCCAHGHEKRYQIHSRSITKLLAREYKALLCVGNATVQQCKNECNTNVYNVVWVLVVVRYCWYGMVMVWLQVWYTFAYGVVW